MARQEEYLLTFDIGTTSVKTCVFNRKLENIASGTEEYSLHAKEGNIVELEAERYFEALVSGFDAIATDAVRQGVKGIVISSQGETLIPVDRRGVPLRNAIVWLDGRAEKEAEEIAALPLHREFYHRTGLPAADGLCPAAKVKWLMDNEPGVYRAAHKILLLEDYLLLRLCGRFVSERTIQCSTGYYDTRHDRWWDAMFAALHLDKGKMPELVECGEEVGTLTAEAAQRLGLPETVRIFAGAMDQIAAAVGGGNIEEGIVTETTGTALVIMATTDGDGFDHADGVIVYRHVLPGKFYYTPYCPTSGMVLKWFKDTCCTEETKAAAQEGRDVYDVLCEMALAIPPGADGLVALPYFTGMLQPENNPSMRGIFAGLTLGATKAHFIRAILEAVAYMLRENLEMIERRTHVDIREVRSFGGAAKSSIWRQIKADVCGKRLVTMRQTECASLGVAMLAACSMGWYPGLEEAAGAQETAALSMPGEKNREVYDAGYGAYKELYQATKEIYKRN